jgi:hypothetical protein
VIVLDTDALSIIQRGSGPRFESLAKLLDDASDDVYVTVSGNVTDFEKIPTLKWRRIP